MRVLVKEEKEGPPEKRVFFSLEQDGTSVIVKAQLEGKDHAWGIIRFTDRGSVLRMIGIDPTVGLELDGFGKVKIS